MFFPDSLSSLLSVIANISPVSSTIFLSLLVALHSLFDPFCHLLHNLSLPFRLVPSQKNSVSPPVLFVVYQVMSTNHTSPQPQNTLQPGTDQINRPELRPTNSALSVSGVCLVASVSVPLTLTSTAVYPIASRLVKFYEFPNSSWSSRQFFRTTSLAEQLGERSIKTDKRS